MLKRLLNPVKNDSFFQVAITLQAVLFLMGLWGCLAIYSATIYHHEPFHFAGRQLLWLLSGMVIMLLASRIPFDLYLDYILPISAIAYLPLIAVLLFGVEVNGMKGWFSTGSVFIQPSELAKGIFLLSLCAVARKFRRGMPRFMIMGGITTLWTIPIILQPDFGTALIYTAGFLIVYWLSGGALRYLLLLPAAAAPLTAYILTRNHYIIRRFTGFFTPEADPLGSGWHVRQFQLTLARGGWWGSSWGKSYWANSYLPLAHSDSVFAALTEAVGFAGALPVLILLAAICLCSFKLALGADSGIRRNFIFSAGTLFAVQSLIHIGVNVTLLPPTGITLPIISYGGSSMIATMFMFGILLSAAGSAHSVFAPDEN